MQIHCSTRSEIFNVMASQSEAPSMASTTTPSDYYSEVVMFTQAHPSPLSLAASLHQCSANHSHYTNNGWTFSRQTSCTRHKKNH